MANFMFSKMYYKNNAVKLDVLLIQSLDVPLLSTLAIFDSTLSTLYKSRNADYWKNYEKNCDPSAFENINNS